jgi:hypothetical protein
LVVQSEHASPNRPQWKSLGVLHLVPSQQPCAHERKPHPPPTDPEPPAPDDPAPDDAPDELPEVALPDDPVWEQVPAWHVAPTTVQS